VSAATILCLCAATMWQTAAYQRANSFSVAFRGEILQEGWATTIATALLILTIPFLVLAAQCSRLGAPARDRRIAAVRLAGATPRQAVTIAVAETGIAALLGSATGLAIYLIGRVVLDNPDEHGIRSLPTNILPPWSTIVAISVGLPLLGAVLAALLLRRVRRSPFAVARQASPSRARPWPIIVALAGVAIFGLPGYGRYVVDLLDISKINNLWEDLEVRIELERFCLYVGMAVASVGIVLSAGWISVVTGRLTRRYTRSAAGLIAASRLTADPWLFSRTLGVLLVAATLGGATASSYSFEMAQYRLSALSGGTMMPGSEQGFERHVFEALTAALGVTMVVAGFALTVVLVEMIVSRRRVYAALVASGVPRSILARASIRQTMTAAAPTVVLATIAGYLAFSLVSAPSGSDRIFVSADQSVEVHIPIAWPQIALVICVALAAVFVTACVGLLFLKPSTSVEELRAG
jgi:multisubunit Na+/H+ antiporter MnhC subunit